MLFVKQDPTHDPHAFWNSKLIESVTGQFQSTTLLLVPVFSSMLPDILQKLFVGIQAVPIGQMEADLGISMARPCEIILLATKLVAA